MAVVTSTLEIDLVDDVTKNAARVGAAIVKMEKEAAALQKVLSGSGTSDRLQKRLQAIGATASHVEGVTKAWKDYSKAEGIAEKSAEWTKAQASSVKNWENMTVAAVRSVRSEEANLARTRAQQASAVIRAAEKEESTRLRVIAREEAAQRKLMEHERSRTDNTVAGFAAIYAAHSSMHAAMKVGERYREFDKERRYAKVVMGLTDEQQKPLVEQAIRESAKTKFNDVQWLETQRSLASRGYNADQVRGFAPTAALIGQAFDTSMPEAVKVFEGAMLGFRKDVSTFEKAQAAAKRTADLEVKTSKISGMDAEDIKALYARGAPAARNAGLTEEQLLAFGASLKKVNINGDEAATAFVSLSKNLQAPTKEARTAMHAAGIDFTKYQKIGTVNEEGFASEVARNYGVKLSAHVKAGLHRIFNDATIMADPDKYTPAVMKFLRNSLNGKDAKSLKSIAGLAGRYRDDSATKVDTEGLMSAIMGGMKKNPLLANAIFGSKQGGKISTGLDPEVFGKLLDLITNHSEGLAEEVSNARMSGFDGALLKFANQTALLETAIGRAFDKDGNGGFLTSTTHVATQFVDAIGKANPALLRAGSEAVLMAGAFSALKGVGFLKGGFGLKVAASALDRSALLLDEAAVKLGAANGVEAAAAAGAVAGGGALTAPAEGSGKGFFKNGIKGVPKGMLAGGPAALAEYFAYSIGTGLIDEGVRDLPFEKNSDATQDHLNNRGVTGTVKDIWNDLFGKATPIAGHRAKGGPVSGGKTYLVGEHGPEILTPGASGAISTHDVQRMLAASSYSTTGRGDAATAKEVAYMGRELVVAVNGITRAIATSRNEGTFAGDDPFYSGSASAGSGHRDFGGGGRRGFMEGGHGSEGTGRKGFAGRRHPGEGPDGGSDIPTDGDSVKTATALLKKREGFLDHAKWDRNHMRLGYGSDTITDADGHVREVKAGDRVSKADAERDLARRIPEFQRKVAREVGVENWKKLSPTVQGALTSMAYNYGGFSKLESMKAAIASGDNSQIAAAIRRRAGDNGGVNSARRLEEAEIVEHGGARNPTDRSRSDGVVSGDVGARLAQFKKAGVLSNQQCVELARRMVGDHGTVHSWRPGEKAEGGTLKPGTPVATFLNSRGQEVGRYADGTVGRPGTHLDHAAVFEGYERDRAGKITGMRVAEQYAGSHGVHDKVYAFHNGKFGEGDGSNYRAVKRDDGTYLGGKNNPMSGGGEDPLGLRKKGDAHPALAALHGGITPAVDGKHLDTTIAKLEHIHHLMHGINTASAKHRRTGTQTAGLGSKLRGGYMHSGSEFG